VDGLYHFVWDEFCDWYLEMIKVRLYGEDEEARLRAAGHARFILDAIVKLVHPFLPFVTEEIAGQYGAAPLINTAAPHILVPLEAAADGQAIAALQGAVNALRAYRAERGVAPAQTLTAVVAAEDGASAALYRGYAPVVRLLARTDLTDHGAPGGDVVIAPGATLQVATTAVDHGPERERLAALLKKLQAEVARLEAKLANESFVGRAPQAVVDKEREKLRGYVADRDEVAARLADLA
jgi:valyl-tRNA synthetase